ncbi:MAG: hypothetical protein Q9184_004871 [Pyrenodesmia sp. 2 TL-2023]
MIYEGMSGALNEHCADVFGALLEQYVQKQTADQADWLLAQDVLFPEALTIAMRSLKAPGTAYDDHRVGKDTSDLIGLGYNLNTVPNFPHLFFTGNPSDEPVDSRRQIEGQKVRRTRRFRPLPAAARAYGPVSSDFPTHGRLGPFKSYKSSFYSTKKSGILRLPLSRRDLYRIRQEADSEDEIWRLTIVFSAGFEAVENVSSLRGYGRDFEAQLAKREQLRKCDNKHAPDLLTYGLKDQYGNKSYRFSSLTPVDQRKVKLLQERCGKQEVRSFLGKLTANVTRTFGLGKDKAKMHLSDLVDFDENVTLVGSQISDETLFGRISMLAVNPRFESVTLEKIRRGSPKNILWIGLNLDSCTPLSSIC